MKPLAAQGALHSSGQSFDGNRSTSAVRPLVLSVTRHPPPATRVLSGLNTRSAYGGIGRMALAPAGLGPSRGGGRPKGTPALLKLTSVPSPSPADRPGVQLPRSFSGMLSRPRDKRRFVTWVAAKRELLPVQSTCTRSALACAAPQATNAIPASVAQTISRLIGALVSQWPGPPCPDSRS
jgi:hypothetical protein